MASPNRSTIQLKPEGELFGPPIFFENLRGPEVENADGITKWGLSRKYPIETCLSGGNLVDNLK
jgi:hypothetical protein